MNMNSCMNIGTCTDMMRQYEALQSLRCLNPHLQKAVFSNSAKGTSTASHDGIGMVVVFSGNGGGTVGRALGAPGMTYHLTVERSGWRLFHIG